MIYIAFHKKIEEAAKWRERNHINSYTEDALFLSENTTIKSTHAENIFQLSNTPTKSMTKKLIQKVV